MINNLRKHLDSLSPEELKESLKAINEWANVGPSVNGFLNNMNRYTMSIDRYAFKEECDEWLKEFNYSLHSSNMDKSWLCYTSQDPDGPAIICKRSGYGGADKCEVNADGVGMMFTSLKSGELQFKHPDIERFINIITYYTILMRSYPPQKL